MVRGARSSAICGQLNLQHAQCLRRRRRVHPSRRVTRLCLQLRRRSILLREPGNCCGEAQQRIKGNYLAASINPSPKSAHFNFCFLRNGGGGRNVALTDRLPLFPPPSLSPSACGRGDAMRAFSLSLPLKCVFISFVNSPNLGRLRRTIYTLLLEEDHHAQSYSRLP